MTPTAIAERLRHHLHGGARLAALAAEGWLDRDQLVTIDALAGKLPFAFDPAETVAAAQVDGAAPCTVYLRVVGRASGDQIRAGLAGDDALAWVGFAVVNDHGQVVASGP